MSNLADYFQRDKAELDHPLLRYLKSVKAEHADEQVLLEVRRPRDLLGFKPAKIYLVRLGADGQIHGLHHDDWDDDLNTALVREHVRAISPDNEIMRFSLALKSALRRAETRFGDGYFNSVLIEHLNDGDLAEQQSIAQILPHIPANRASRAGPAYEDCRMIIDNAIGERARELIQLGYDEATASRILASAIAQYLDERFSVTTRRLLGW